MVASNHNQKPKNNNCDLPTLAVVTRLVNGYQPKTLEYLAQSEHILEDLCAGLMVIRRCYGQRLMRLTRANERLRARYLAEEHIIFELIKIVEKKCQGVFEQGNTGLK